MPRVQSKSIQICTAHGINTQSANAHVGEKNHRLLFLVSGEQGTVEKDSSETEHTDQVLDLDKAIPDIETPHGEEL